MGEVTVRPAAADHWTDLEDLFGANGACGGCWCMFWRVPGTEFRRIAGDDALRRLRGFVDSADPPGLLAYSNDETRGNLAVGWCAVAPREQYARILRSPNLRPDDPDEPDVWSVPCFYVRVGHRRAGVSRSLLVAAVRYAAAYGARAVEGYPVDPRRRKYASGELYTGTVDMFAAEGFREALRRSPGRPIMRLALPSPT